MTAHVIGHAAAVARLALLSPVILAAGSIWCARAALAWATRHVAVRLGAATWEDFR